MRKRTSTQLLLLSLENMKMKFKKWSGLGREFLDFWLPCPPMLSPVSLCILYDWEIPCFIQNSFSHSNSNLLDHLQTFISSLPLLISVSCSHGLQYGQGEQFLVLLLAFSLGQCRKKNEMYRNISEMFKIPCKYKIISIFYFATQKRRKKRRPHIKIKNKWTKFFNKYIV